jgi:hypothetical protein
MTCSVAGVYNITCHQGATLQRTLTWTDPAKTPINLTSYTARMHVRTVANANTTILELTTENSRIALGGTAGTVNLTVAANVTANLTPALYVYDLEVVSGGGVVTRLVEGNFNVTAEVTR